MSECRNWRMGQKCLNFYECKKEGEVVKSGKKLQQFCFYCLGTPGIKKIGHKASWAGNTPKWCPLGRDSE